MEEEGGKSRTKRSNSCGSKSSRDGNDHVKIVVLRCLIDYLKRNATHVEGILCQRQRCLTEDIRKLRDSIERAGRIDIERRKGGRKRMRDVLNSATNLHMVAEIFLRYLREMKTTFSIPFETVTADIDVERDEFSSPQIFVPYVQKILGEETNEEIDDDVSEEDENDDVYDDTGDVSKSPPSRRHLLRDVFALLSRVEKNPENGVSALDLAHSVGPSLCIPKEGAYMSLLHI